MRIGILGSRGIAGHYQKKEIFASFLSEALVQKGYSVCVYSSHNHSYQQKEWRGVELIHVFDPEKTLVPLGVHSMT
ncbi:MAG: hypothetical protein HC819_16740 [Cyclobacteriaceae bacterium]|nr:hypothetical protein [Cyclobacteriaceae bacterium]